MNRSDRGDGDTCAPYGGTIATDVGGHGPWATGCGAVSRSRGLWGRTPESGDSGANGLGRGLRGRGPRPRADRRLRLKPP